MKQKLQTPIIGAMILAVLTLIAPASVSADDWSVDEAHTEVNFSVSHFFTPVNGKFDDFEIELNYDADNPAKSTVSVKIPVASINTGNERRDNHLRSDDWFSADAHPYITFESKSVRKAGSDRLIAKGLLTIKGKAQPVELEIALLGTRQIPEQMQQMLQGARQVASFEADTSVDRAAFEVGVGTWATDMVVGKEINIKILLEAHQKG